MDASVASSSEFCDAKEAMFALTRAAPGLLVEGDDKGLWFGFGGLSSSGSKSKSLGSSRRVIVLMIRLSY